MWAICNYNAQSGDLIFPINKNKIPIWAQPTLNKPLQNSLQVLSVTPAELISG